MPATVVLVVEDADFRFAVAEACTARGLKVAQFADALDAMQALENAREIELLITQAGFAAGRSNGVALMLMMRSRKPQTAAIFLGGDCFSDYIDASDVALPANIDVAELMAQAERELQRVRAG